MAYLGSLLYSKFTTQFRPPPVSGSPLTNVRTFSLRPAHQRDRNPVRGSVPRAKYDSCPTNLAEGNERPLTSAIVNLSPASSDQAFGQSQDGSVKAKIITLIASVRTLMRSTVCPVTLTSTIHTNACAPAVPLVVINTLIIVYELILG